MSENSLDYYSGPALWIAYCNKKQELETMSERVKELEVQLARRDAYISELEQLAKLHVAVEMACGELPEGWEIAIIIEKNAGSVELYDVDGIGIDFPSDCELIAQQVSDAIEFAKSEA